MSRIDALVEQFGRHISAPWQRYISGAEKIIFVVYPKEDELRLRKRIGLFEQRCGLAGHPWQLLDLTDMFPEWISKERYKDEYFRKPDYLNLKLDQFRDYCVKWISAVLEAQDPNTGPVLAILGGASLFGVTRLHEVLERIQSEIKGRLVVFFAGSYEQNNYRHLDARDEWNYMAVPIYVTSTSDGAEK